MSTGRRQPSPYTVGVPRVSKGMRQPPGKRVTGPGPRHSRPMQFDVPLRDLDREAQEEGRAGGYYATSAIGAGRSADPRLLDAITQKRLQMLREEREREEEQEEQFAREIGTSSQSPGPKPPYEVKPPYQVASSSSPKDDSPEMSLAPSRLSAPKTSPSTAPRKVVTASDTAATTSWKALGGSEGRGKASAPPTQQTAALPKKGSSLSANDPNRVFRPPRFASPTEQQKALVGGASVTTTANPTVDTTRIVTPAAKPQAEPFMYLVEQVWDHIGLTKKEGAKPLPLSSDEEESADTSTQRNGPYSDDDLYLTNVSRRLLRQYPYGSPKSQKDIDLVNKGGLSAKKKTTKKASQDVDADEDEQRIVNMLQSTQLFMDLCRVVYNTCFYCAGYDETNPQRFRIEAETERSNFGSSASSHKKFGRHATNPNTKRKSVEEQLEILAEERNITDADVEFAEGKLPATPLSGTEWMFVVKCAVDMKYPRGALYALPPTLPLSAALLRHQEQRRLRREQLDKHESRQHELGLGRHNSQTFADEEKISDLLAILTPEDVDHHQAVLEHTIGELLTFMLWVTCQFGFVKLAQHLEFADVHGGSIVGGSSRTPAAPLRTPVPASKHTERRSPSTSGAEDGEDEVAGWKFLIPPCLVGDEQNELHHGYFPAVEWPPRGFPVERRAEYRRRSLYKPGSDCIDDTDLLPAAQRYRLAMLQYNRLHTSKQQFFAALNKFDGGTHTAFDIMVSQAKRSTDYDALVAALKARMEIPKKVGSINIAIREASEICSQILRHVPHSLVDYDANNDGGGVDPKPEDGSDPFELFIGLSRELNTMGGKSARVQRRWADCNVPDDFDQATNEGIVTNSLNFEFSLRSCLARKYMQEQRRGQAEGLTMDDAPQEPFVANDTLLQCALGVDDAVRRLVEYQQPPEEDEEEGDVATDGFQYKSAEDYQRLMLQNPASYHFLHVNHMPSGETDEVQRMVRKLTDPFEQALCGLEDRKQQAAVELEQRMQAIGAKVIRAARSNMGASVEML